jgi:branched-subunit amino acid transport protein
VSPSSAVLAVLVIGMITFASRAAMINLLADRTLPVEVSRALRYVGPAVLSALTVNLVAGGQGVGGIEAEEVVAVTVSIVVAAATRNLIAALVAGMVVLWALLWIV